VQFAADTETALNTGFQQLRDAENHCGKLRHAALSTRTTFQGDFVAGVTRAHFPSDAARAFHTVLAKAFNSARQSVPPKVPVAAKSHAATSKDHGSSK
jgi:hypothetical protein